MERKESQFKKRNKRPSPERDLDSSLIEISLSKYDQSSSIRYPQHDRNDSRMRSSIYSKQVNHKGS